MSDNIIDTVFAEAAAQPSTEQTVDTNPEPVEAENVEEAGDSPEPTKDEPFPKKAVNALSRRDKQIGKLKAQFEYAAAERAQLMAELEKYRSGQSVAPKRDPNQAPKEEDYSNYGDFIKDQAKYEFRQEQQANQPKTPQKTEADIRQEIYLAERSKAVAKQAQDFVASNAEAREMLSEYSQEIDELPRHIGMAFLESENPSLALFNLIREGKLDALATMSPTQAAREIARAEMMPAKKQVSSAPSPVTQAKGSGTGSKSVHSMSTDELLKWYQS